MVLDAKVWGPHYWFVLLTIALSYPKHPNDVTKKKYYELIQNFPLFMPDSQIGNGFSDLLDKYPVTPYLDSRESFVKWVHFMHNRVNIMLGKDEITLTKALDNYYGNYKPRQQRWREELKYRQKLIYVVIIIILLVGIKYFYNK